MNSEDRKLLRELDNKLVAHGEQIGFVRSDISEIKGKVDKINGCYDEVNVKCELNRQMIKNHITTHPKSRRFSLFNLWPGR